MRRFNYGNHDGLLTFLFSAIIVFPCIRVFVTNAPQWLYFMPVLGLILVALQRLILQPWKKFSLPVVCFAISALTLFLWLAITSIWSISITQYLSDLFLVGALAAVTLLSAILMNSAVLDRFMKLLGLLAAFVGLFVVAEYFLIGSLKSGESQLSDTYLTIADLIGVAATGSTIRYIVGTKTEKFWGFLSLLLLLELSLSLARGALFFTVIIVVAAAFILPVIRMAGSKKIQDWFHGSIKISIIILLIIGTFVMAMQVERTRTRILRIFTGNELETGGRGVLWETALDNIVDSPWVGHGLGSNGFLSAGHDGGYPHNLFLQVWLDGGALAVLFLVVTVLIPLGFAIKWLWHPKNRLGVLVLPLAGMYMFMLLEYSKSGNFYTARSLFLLGTAVMVVTTETQIRPSDTFVVQQEME